MKRMLFAMMLGILVFPGFTLSANAHERGPVSRHNGVAFGLNLIIGGGSPSHSIVFSLHNPRSLVVPGGVYSQRRHHRPSHSHFEERHHGPRIGVDTHVTFPSHHKRRPHVYSNRGHHDYNKKHHRRSRPNRDHHYR